jgi:hypothetical protein
MAGIDFKLSDNSDIQIVGGKFILLETTQESVRQRLQTKYRTSKGEWFLNTTYGIPYFDGVFGGVTTQGILGKNYSKSEIDAIFINETNIETDVIRITRFNSELNRLSRAYDVDLEVLTTDGLIRVVIPSISPNDEIEYPVPPEFVVTPDCGADNTPIDGVFINNPKPNEWIAPSNQYMLLTDEPALPYIDSGYFVDGYII